MLRFVYSAKAPLSEAAAAREIQAMAEIIRRDRTTQQSRAGRSVWTYRIDTRFTSYDVVEGIHLETILLSGETCSDAVLASVLYTFPECRKVNTHRILGSSLEELLPRIWQFVEEKKICLDCGELCFKTQPCPGCLFFQGFLRQRGESVPQCSICHEEVCRTRLPCGHYFHKLCLLQMLEHAAVPNEDAEDRPRCPNCRTVLPEEYLKYALEVEHEADEDPDFSGFLGDTY